MLAEGLEKVRLHHCKVRAAIGQERLQGARCSGALARRSGPGKHWDAEPGPLRVLEAGGLGRQYASWRCTTEASQAAAFCWSVPAVPAAAACMACTSSAHSSASASGRAQLSTASASRAAQRMIGDRVGHGLLLQGLA